MFLSNTNTTPKFNFNNVVNYANLAVAPSQSSLSLKSSMITRIHNIKPGCGSCGRK